MGLLSIIDRWTGAERRQSRRIAQRIADNSGISLQRKQRLAEHAGLDLPDSKRRWEAGRTDRLNSGHWSPVTGQPINADLASYLTELRHRSEYEAANNAMAKGMILTYSLCCIGEKGPTLRVHSANEKYTAARQKVWQDWYAHAGSNPQLSGVEILNSWVSRLFSCGEWLTQIVTLPQRYAPGPIRQRLLPIHPHRLLTPPEFLGDPDIALGVRRDTDYDIPLKYYITKPYIWGPFELYTGQYKEIPYRDMLHGFVREEDYQVRGVPWLATCLPTLAQLRDFTAETLDAARAAADYAIYLKTQAGAMEAPAPLASEVANIERRTVRTLIPGWEVSGASPAHPGPEYVPFYESLAREVAASVCMPLMILLHDAAKHNLSSARFDAQMFWKQIGRTQGMLGRQLDRVEASVATEAELAGLLPSPPPDVATEWVWEPQPQMDPKTECETTVIELEAGTIDYGEACERLGKDPAQVIAKRKKWQDKLKESGLPPIPGIPEKVGGAPGQQGGPAEPMTGAPKAPAAKNGKDKANGRFAMPV